MELRILHGSTVAFHQLLAQPPLEWVVWFRVEIYAMLLIQLAQFWQLIAMDITYSFCNRSSALVVAVIFDTAQHERSSNFESHIDIKFQTFLSILVLALPFLMSLIQLNKELPHRLRNIRSIFLSNLIIKAMHEVCYRLKSKRRVSKNLIEYHICKYKFIFWM